jgi:hypothetical protein
MNGRLKSHFTSLISTISFTLYALLPTLQPQLFERYPIEHTSQALQGMSMTSSIASIQPEGGPPHELERISGLQLNRDGSDTGTSVTGEEASSAVGESWASEFQHRGGRESGTAVCFIAGSMKVPNAHSFSCPRRPRNRCHYLLICRRTPIHLHPTCLAQSCLVLHHLGDLLRLPRRVRKSYGRI